MEHNTREGWFPLRGSWEEAVLSWNEQVEISFRRREARMNGWGEERHSLQQEHSEHIKAQ